MTVVRTNLHIVESARWERVEPTKNVGGSITATNVQEALQDLDSKASGNAALEFVLDGGDQPLTVSQEVRLTVPFGCSIKSATLFADQSDSLVVDLMKSTYAGFPGSLASITASDTPTLSSAQKVTDSTLTGWTTTISSGDIVVAHVTSTGGVIRQATLSLTVVRT